MNQLILNEEEYAESKCKVITAESVARIIDEQIKKQIKSKHYCTVFGNHSNYKSTFHILNSHNKSN
jgi:hypothetical protein